MSASNKLFSSIRRTAVVVGLSALASCGAPQVREAPALQPLPESRALEVIRAGFDEAHVQPELHRHIRVRGNREMEIDMATAGHDHGVEYIQAQDRVDLGDAIPERRVQGSLLTMVGMGDDARVDVLLLDDREFMYQADTSFTGPGQPTLVEVEDRLQRAVVDYLTYLQHHGEL